MSFGTETSASGRCNPHGVGHGVRHPDVTPSTMGGYAAADHDVYGTMG